MKIIKNILVAVDFMDATENVLKNAINFAKTFNSKITLIHILPDDIRNEKVSQLIEHTVVEKLKEANDRIIAEGIATDTPILEYGNFIYRIIEASEVQNVNLIIVGSGNKAKDDAFQLGTTAEKLIRKCHKPVFVIKNGQTLQINNIICPVDFSKESARALNSAIIAARILNAKLVILSVYLRFNLSIAKLDPVEVNKFRHEDLDAEFNEFLKEFNLIDLNYEKVIEGGGDTAEEILKAIEKYNSDLLIMGTTGRSGFSKILMGSVTEKVIRKVPCSFITVKNEDIMALEIESKIQDIEKHHILAQQLFEKGFFEESILQYKRCLSINFMHLPSLKGISKTYEKVGDLDNAKKYQEMVGHLLTQIENMKIEKEVRQQMQH